MIFTLKRWTANDRQITWGLITVLVIPAFYSILKTEWTAAIILLAGIAFFLLIQWYNWNNT